MWKRLPVALALIVLVAIFWWVYGRFAGSLYFVLDDTIETYAALSRPLGQAIIDSFTGHINWSGYRPVSYAGRALMSHLFALDTMIGYYLVSLGLHLVNTILVFALGRVFMQNVAWAFIAALFFLLLPAHNEAVLYMSANANLIALFFCLISLLASLAPPRRPGPRWWDALSALSYLLAVLAYEIVLPLPVFVALVQWRRRDLTRQRLLLYLGYGGAIIVALGLRIWAGAGRLTPGREDYTLSLAPLHLLQGYAVFLGQMILLHTSAWIGLPLFSNIREWMSPLNPRAIVSVALTAGGSIAVLALALRTHRPTPSGDAAPSRRVDPFWIAWGLLWLAAMSILFAALAGRHPENRYTYVPSLGLSIAIGALSGWLYGALARRPALAGAWLGLIIAILTGYAYVSTSDVSAWERASLHTRSFVQQSLQRLPSLPNGVGVALMGMPGVVGNVFTFNTEESFHAAIQMLYGSGVGQTWVSDLALLDALRQNTSLGDNAVLLAYDRSTHTVHPANRALLCREATECNSFSFLNPSEDHPWTYVQSYRQASPQEGGLAMLFDPAGGRSPRLASCWAFYDLQRVEIDPSQFDETALAARCAKLAADLVTAGALDLPPTPQREDGAP